MGGSMIKICKQNQESVLKKIYKNDFDIVTASTSNLVDDIILAMYEQGILECLTSSIKDKRAHNTTIPFNLVLALSVAAKMKTRTSLSDIPFAITDHRVLSKLGYNVVDTKGGLMRESSLRFLLGKYTAEELFDSYNRTVQDYIMPKLNISPNIHILDCTEISVNINNPNYEKAAYTKNKYDENDRGYKLATIRGIVEDTGIIEEIRFDAMNVHDFKLSEEMLRTTKVFKPGDILIEDRGFLDRDNINYLKTVRQVDTYIPLKTNMIAYDVAVKVAKEENVWEKHPSRRNQKISFVTELGPLWLSKNSEEDVPLNGCIIWDVNTDEYSVFITTDTEASAKQIISTYELRPEIEEDYRQLKDFWHLQDFKSTKLNMIAYHIIITLFGYMFFQLYTLTPEGEQYAHKSLPVIIKNYQPKKLPYIIFYADNEFAIFSIVEFAKIYTKCCISAQKRLEKYLC